MDCKTWLALYLSDGQVHLTTAVSQKEKALGYSKSELREARKELGVKTFHQFDEFGDTENWFWHMEDEKC